MKPKCHNFNSIWLPSLSLLTSGKIKLMQTSFPAHLFRVCIDRRPSLKYLVKMYLSPLLPSQALLSQKADSYSQSSHTAFPPLFSPPHPTTRFSCWQGKKAARLCLRKTDSVSVFKLAENEWLNPASEWAHMALARFEFMVSSLLGDAVRNRMHSFNVR